MTARTYQFVTAILVGFVAPQRSLGQEDVASTLAHVRAAWSSLAESPSSIAYTYSTKVYRGETTESLKLETERVVNTFDCPEGMKGTNTTYLFRSGERKFDERTVSLGNDHYSCLLKQNGEDGPFILEGLPKMRETKWEENRTAERRQFTRLPWLMPEGTYRIPDVLDPARSTITRLGEQPGGLIRLAFRPKPNLDSKELEKFRGVISGVVTLNPNAHYRVEQTEIQSDPERNSSSRSIFAYSDESSYLVSRIEKSASWTIKGTGTKMVAKQVWEYEWPKESDVDPQQFYMSHYGLPEPMGVTPPAKPMPLYVWLLMAAGGLAVIAILLGWVARRRARAKTTPSAPTLPKADV